MKLAFLGKTYEADFPMIECSETDEQLMFLGRPYAQRQAKINHRYKSVSELTYRGVRYQG